MTHVCASFVARSATQSEPQRCSPLRAFEPCSSAAALRLTAFFRAVCLRLRLCSITRRATWAASPERCSQRSLCRFVRNPLPISSLLLWTAGCPRFCCVILLPAAQRFGVWVRCGSVCPRTKHAIALTQSAALFLVVVVCRQNVPVVEWGARLLAALPKALKYVQEAKRDVDENTQVRVRIQDAQLFVAFAALCEWSVFRLWLASPWGSLACLWCFAHRVLLRLNSACACSCPCRCPSSRRGPISPTRGPSTSRRAASWTGKVRLPGWGPLTSPYRSSSKAAF